MPWCDQATWWSASPPGSPAVAKPSNGILPAQNADQLVVPVLVMSCAGFCGVQAVLALVTLHGALAAVTVTTARKALSILISFVAFTKPFTIQ